MLDRMSETKAVKTDEDGCEWVGPTGAFAPQLPDKWPSEWPESELDGGEAVKRLQAMWDSDIEPLSLPYLAQRSERIGMQGWFGTRLDRDGGGPDAKIGPEGRRYSPELYAATFAWIQAEQAYRAVEAAKEATQAAKDASVAAVDAAKEATQAAKEASAAAVRVSKITAGIACLAGVVAVLQLLFG